MSLIACPECRIQISDIAISCPGCGYPLRRVQIRLQEQQREQERLERERRDSERQKKLDLDNKIKEMQRTANHCPECNGTGYTWVSWEYPESDNTKCYKCNGSGRK